MPEQSPLERAARALCRQQGLPEDYTGPGTCGDPSWMFKVPEARAVLMAIREPTDAMRNAAQCNFRPDSTVISIYQDMIDAALGE